MVEYGIVRFFNGREGKQFGFLMIVDNNGSPTGEEIFFHYNGGRFVGDDGEIPTFDGDTRRVDGVLFKLQRPQPNDKLVFTRSPGLKGDKANPWSYALEWETRVEWLAKRPRIRVVRNEQNLFGRPDGSWETTIMWEGQNRFELSARYPIWEYASNGRLLTRDDLDHLSIEDGYVVTNYYFEVQGDGGWSRCADPRVMRCCIPPRIFRKFARSGLQQDRCYHS